MESEGRYLAGCAAFLAMRRSNTKKKNAELQEIADIVFLVRPGFVNMCSFALTSYLWWRCWYLSGLGHISPSFGG